MIEMFRPLEPLERDVLALLVKGWTSPIDALQQAKCFSLAQRVSCMRRQGYDIEKRWEVLPSGKRVMAYRIAPVKQCQGGEITGSHYDHLLKD